MQSTLDDYHWLTSAAALPWLALARARANPAGIAALQLVAELRKALPAERVHLVLEQTELHVRAREKFALAEQMYFTRKGLEQASDQAISEYKASRFVPHAAVADLCCGIGGDLLALGRRGPAIGIELDPAAAHLAGQNCAVNGSVATLQVHDATQFPLGDVAAWHIDPDRRPAGKRTTRVELHEPPLETLERMLGENPAAAIKLAPAAEIPPAWSETAEREWIGSRGECRQQVLWFGSLARHGGKHAATIVDSPGGPRSVIGEPDREASIAERIGRYIYEPHNAILAAHLEVALAAELGLQAIAPRVAYFTSDALASDPALAAFEVLDLLPLDQKRLKAYFREHAIGRLEVKKRGIDIEPEKLRRAVVGSGTNSATLFACPLGGRVQAIVARRISVATS